MNLAKRAKTIALALLGEPNKTLSSRSQVDTSIYRISGAV
jgi:hypothetical protein